MENPFAERLRRARDIARLTQAELARRVGISPQAIQHLESGKAQNSRYLLKIAGVLSVDPEWLLTGEQASEQAPTRFNLPLGEGVSAEKRRELAELWWSETDDDPEDYLVFPRKNVSFRASHIPVFLGKPYIFTELPKYAIRKQRGQLISWLSNNSDRLSEEAVRAVADRSFFIIPDSSPEEFLPRPHYLAGQLEAYALFLTTPPWLAPRIGQVETLHVSPYKQPEYTDMIIIWHKSNSFVVGEFIKQGPSHIEIKHPELWSAWVDWIGEHGFTVEGQPENTLALALSEIEAVHTVVGAEFTIPRSARTRDITASYRSRFDPNDI